MPPRKTLPRLSTFSLQSIGDYVHRYCVGVAKHSYCIATHIYPGEIGLECAERRASTYTNEQIEALQSRLFTSIPHYCYQSLVDVILSVLTNLTHSSKAIYRKVNTPDSIHEIHVVVRFCNLILHQRIRCLDLSKLPKVLRDVLYKHLSQLSGLEVLNLGSGNGEAGRRRMFMSLKYMTNLQSLTLNNDCQNETLAVIGQNCHKLKVLDINSSQSVTDQGVTWLLQCPDLTELNLYHTSISNEAYAQLLLGLPKLRNIGRCDSFGSVLEYLQTYNSSQVTVNLRKFHSRDMNYDQLQLLVTICPKLQSVNLYVDEEGNLLEPLTQLADLRELILLSCNFYSDRVNDLLVKQGKHLRLLHLEHVDELDMDALSCIAKTCPKLNKLVFFSCDFVENFGPAHLDQEFVDPPFRHLETLICVSETAPNIVQFLLIHSPNVKKVQFGSSAWFNDDTVRTVISRNALRNVEEIRILRSYELTMQSVDLLLENCPNLRVLAEIDGWEGITEMDLASLRQMIKERNYDLDTFISWSVTG